MMELRESLAGASQLRDKNPRFQVFAGHDTVIAPVLAALGIYQSPLCKLYTCMISYTFFLFLVQ